MTIAIAVRERPILFSGPMIRAILDGTKTQTRRVMTPQPLFSEALGCWLWDRKGRGMTKPEGANYEPPYGFSEPNWLHLCPYGALGDRLWVRETWDVGFTSYEQWVRYRADAAHQPVADEHRDALLANWDNHPSTGWRSPIHMPRWASRISLELTSVRVQRLQDISEEDAIAEGAQAGESSLTQEMSGSARGDFARIWNELNAQRGYPFADNCWVWALSFTVLQRPGGLR